MTSMARDFMAQDVLPAATMTSDAVGITISGIAKGWGGATVIDNLTLDIPAGKFTAILGPSGCGKSTILRLIAGLDAPDRGRILMGGRDVTGLPPALRDIAMVFQSYALFPHLNVAENILFGMKVRRTPRSVREASLARTAELLELTPLLGRKPAQLSGGQQQRVALARAIVAEKSVFLMDEPLSNLDARLRHDMRAEIRGLQQKLGVTMVYVTHDQIEAVTMADQVVLMNQGRVEQVADPQTLYDQPATVFAAGFIGTPPMCLFPVAALDPDALSPGIDGSLHLGMRPECFELSETGPIAARVLRSEFQGSDTLVTAEANGAVLTLRLPGSRSMHPNAFIRLGFRDAKLHIFDTASGRRRDDLSGKVRGGLDPG